MTHDLRRQEYVHPVTISKSTTTYNPNYFKYLKIIHIKNHKSIFKNITEKGIML